ncbi:imidazolonepropionase, partial [Streptomyces sp. SID8352]|nr:imidazolonepropionase [Streptomyces sp. SID8352]
MSTDTRTGPAGPPAPGGSTAIVNIAALVTNDPSLRPGSPLGTLRDAAV